MAIISASSGLRPLRTSSSTNLSRAPESLLSPWTTGSSSAMRAPHSGAASSGSRARIHARLPDSVLISPLWPSRRIGWARLHLGAVFVLNRRWSTAKWLTNPGSWRSG